MAKETPKRDPQLSCGIGEYYKNPLSVNARTTIEKLLLGISLKYLEGLDGIILCDEPSFKEHYGNDEKISTARYIKTKDGKSSWIEICVDRLIRELGWAVKIRFVRDWVFSEALYHEIGHHIHLHRTQGPHNEECEDVAEKWRKHLQRRYMIRKYWFIIIPLLIIFLPFRRQIHNLIGHCRFEKPETS